MTTDGASLLAGRRKQLIELLSAFSEERWAAGWMRDIDKQAYQEGGVWEIIGREIGWPIGYEGEDGWLSWYAAGRHYGVPVSRSGALGLLNDRATKLRECLTAQLEADYPLTYERVYWLVCGLSDYAEVLRGD